MCACAYGERTKWMKPMPWRLMSSTKTPWPCTRRRSSLRGTLWPFHVSAGASVSVVSGATVVASASFGRRLDRLEDVPVAGAAADVALQALLDLVLARGAGSRAGARSRSSASPACSSRTAARGASLNACCSFVSSSPSASPSTVSMLEPSAWTASSMQLFTSVPSTITEHAPQLPVSQPMWLPVRSRSSRMKWISSLRASTSRSYVVPLTVTAIVCEVETVSASTWCQLLFFAAWATARTASTCGEVRAVLARRVHVGGRGRGSRRRRQRRTAASSSESGSSTTGTASTQPSAILRLPLIDAAALTMHVPSTPSVTAAKPSARPAGIRDLRQELAGADRGHVDAEEEVLRRRPCARRPRRAIVISAPSAASSGGRWLVGSLVQTLPPIVPRFRTCTSAICAQTSPRIGRARASLDCDELGVGRHRADLERAVGRRGRCPSAPRCGSGRSARRASPRAPSSR